MKKICFTSLFLVSSLLFLGSCSSKTEKQTTDKNAKETSTDSIAKKWKLVSEKEDSSSDIVMDLVKNGNFQINTVINDPKIVKAGIAKIQPISHGTWKYDGGYLYLDYIKSDANKADKLAVKSITNNELHLVGKNGKSRKYIIYEEK